MYICDTSPRRRNVDQSTDNFREDLDTKSRSCGASASEPLSHGIEPPRSGGMPEEASAVLMEHTCSEIDRELSTGA
jgi:hypothetical protein